MAQRKFIDLPSGQFIPLTALCDNTGAPVAASAGSNRVDITSGTSDQTFVAANPARKGLLIDNESTSVLYLLFATGTSSVTNYSVRVPAGANINLGANFYTGIIKGVWASANGFARITEFV